MSRPQSLTFKKFKSAWGVIVEAEKLLNVVAPCDSGIFTHSKDILEHVMDSAVLTLHQRL